MKAYYNYGNTGRKVASIFMAVIYMILVATVTRLGRSGEVPMFMGASVLGVLTAVQFLIALLMVSVEYEVGGAIALGVVSISTVIAVLPMLIMHNLNALPGVLNYAACLIAIFTIRNQLINERKRSTIDELTGIGNRNSLMTYMKHLINTKTDFYVILLDVDHFKKLNDAVGHSRGDEILKELAVRWNEIYASTAFIGRLGGDEFVVVMKKRHCNNVNIPIEKYIEVVEKIARAPHSICPTLSISVGVVESPAFGNEVDDLLKKADVSVRKAQVIGRNASVIYQNELEKEVVREQYVESRIKDALDDQLFYMVYQPQFDINTKKIRGFESLIRMKSNNGQDIVSPGEFIPIAENTNLIDDIGEYVIRKVMTDFVDVVKANPDITVSINLSGKQLLESGFVDSLQELIEEMDFPARNLEIEITEYSMMDTTGEALAIINDMKSTGIKLALDDFGTGFSSFSYLNKLPIDLLKIDKSLVDDMGGGELIEAICTMSNLLKCEVIAEGVEYDFQVELLKSKKCNYIQGFIWSKPLEYEEALKLISMEADNATSN